MQAWQNTTRHNTESVSCLGPPQSLIFEMRLLPGSLRRSTRPCFLQVPLTFCRPNHTMAIGEAIEEQSLPRYHEKDYYPVKIGEVFKDQCRVIAKLGYGAYSTVWLAWDQRSANPIYFRERSPGILVFTHSTGQSSTPHSKYVLDKILNLRRFLMRSICCAA